MGLHRHCAEHNRDIVFSIVSPTAQFILLPAPRRLNCGSLRGRVSFFLVEIGVGARDTQALVR